MTPAYPLQAPSVTQARTLLRNHSRTICPSAGPMAALVNDAGKTDSAPAAVLMREWLVRERRPCGEAGRAERLDVCQVPCPMLE
jgi:hypothetical protein